MAEAMKLLGVILVVTLVTSFVIFIAILLHRRRLQSRIIQSKLLSSATSALPLSMANIVMAASVTGDRIGNVRSSTTELFAMATVDNLTSSGSRRAKPTTAERQSAGMSPTEATFPTDEGRWWTQLLVKSRRRRRLAVRGFVEVAATGNHVDSHLRLQHHQSPLVNIGRAQNAAVAEAMSLNKRQFPFVENVNYVGSMTTSENPIHTSGMYRYVADLIYPFQSS